MDWQRDLEDRVPYANRFTLNYCAEVPRFAWARIIDDPTGSGRGRVLHMLGHFYQQEGNLKGTFSAQRLIANFLLAAIRKR